MSTKFVDCGGVQVEVSDAAAIAISSLLDKHTTEVTSLNQRILDMEAKTKESDEELAKAEAKAEESEKKATDAIAQTSPEALDALVAERLSVIDGAKKLAPDLEVKGLDSKAIKVAALEAIDVDLEGKSDAYIEAAFDARVDSAKAEPESHRAARQIADSAKGKSAKGGPVNFMDAAEKARQKVMDEKRNAHKRAAGGE